MCVWLEMTLSQPTTQRNSKLGPKSTYLVLCYTGDSEARSLKSVPPAGRLQQGPACTPPAGPPQQPGGGEGRGFAAKPVHCSGPMHRHLTQ